MSVYVLSALHRERRRLTALLECLTDGRNTPPSVVDAVRAARDSLFEAEAAIRVEGPTTLLTPPGRLS